MTVCYTWFHERFRVLSADATDETVRVYARAYILMLLSSQLFADKNANRVHLRWLPYLASLDDLGRYSWGSAALAWVYRCLCRGTNRNVVNLAGPLQLLQSWIFWRFSTLRPTGFDRFGFPLASRWAEFVLRNDAGAQRLVSTRLVLDRLRVHDFVWEPYSSVDVATVIHLEILADEHRRLWTAVTSLIYFAAIEWHQVDRVLPQFGGVQHLPQPALNIDWLHAKDGRGGTGDFPRIIRSGTSFGRTGFSQSYGSIESSTPVHQQSTLSGGAMWRTVDYRVPRRRGRRPPEWPNRRGAGDRGPSEQGDDTHHVPGEEVVGSASAMDQPTFDVGTSFQLFGNVTPHAFTAFTTAAVGMDIDDPVTESEFYRDIADMLRDDDDTHYRPQMPEEHARGTPASAFSAVPAQPSAPVADPRPRRVRRPPLCGTGGHLLGQFDDDDSDTIEDSD
ncbi:hypothetical protein Ahy_A05g025203 [Arachis hypogaea]|uniref:Aminotransferase-like plant mobile domain-containing protein n=1 Tax=Arachis hypogaea TaxID=3818 RepID=A0A445D7V5_ARAHY|nr:hypothetical protein Ahy_A05g025203 [Arachis hypogaea]